MDAALQRLTLEDPKMSIVKKLSFSLVCIGAALAIVFGYFQLNREYYFPARYEYAYGVMAWALILSAVGLVVVVATHFWRR